ncbi:hypothetical protein ACXYTP_21475 [Tsukamurella ocularis]
MTANTDENPTAPDGRPWWLPRYWEGTKRNMGGVRRAAAFLYFEMDLGKKFTMRDIRAAIGDEGVPNDDAELARRLRELREVGWRIDSYKDRADLKPAEYIVVTKGAKVWLGGSLKPQKPSNKLRREVLDRDGRCVKCGALANEPYPGEPDTRARLTIGHRIAGNRLTRDISADEVEAQCARCNETAGDRHTDPENLGEVLPEVGNLGRKDAATLLDWLEHDRRLQSTLDRLHARVRRLSPSERAVVVEKLPEKSQPSHSK